MTPLDTDRGKSCATLRRSSARATRCIWGTGGCDSTSRWTLDGALRRRDPRAERGTRRAAPTPATPRAGYYLELRRTPGPDGQGNRDSASGRPGPPALERTDTIARLAPLDIAEVVGDAGRRFERRVFSGVDQWGALPDGSLWVARVYENRVDWRDPDGPVDPGRAAARSGARGDPLRPRALPPPVSARAPQHGRAASVRRRQAAVRSRAHRRRRRGLAGEEPRAGRFHSPLSRGGSPRPAAGGDPGPGFRAYHRRGDGRRAGGGAGPRWRPADAIRPSGPRGRSTPH